MIHYSPYLLIIQNFYNPLITNKKRIKKPLFNKKKRFLNISIRKNSYALPPAIANPEGVIPVADGVPAIFAR